MRLLFLTAIFAFANACTVGFSSEQPGAFPCSEDIECTDGFVCVDGFCESEVGSESGCSDRDGDGWCVGSDLTESAACATDATACSTEDCDDTNADIYPGAPDRCDGVNNDCDGETDEPVECTDERDCPSEGAYFAQCNSGQCDYLGPIRTAAECQIPLTCIGGSREPIPATCM